MQFFSNWFSVAAESLQFQNKRSNSDDWGGDTQYQLYKVTISNFFLRFYEKLIHNIKKKTFFFYIYIYKIFDFLLLLFCNFENILNEC